MLHHLKETVRIQRLKGSVTGKQALVATATADASLQPYGKDASQIDSGLFGSTFVLYVEADIPLQKGDRVVDSNGVKYDVTDVVTRDFGAFPYKEAMLKRS